MSHSTGDELDSQDMVRLVAGHDPALNQLMERHGERLFHYLLRSLQNEEDALDLAQETFARVYLNRDKFDPAQRFSTWLFSIASNLVRNRYRWRERHPQVSLDVENDATGESLGEALPEARPSPNETLQAHERGEAVRRAVAALPEKFRMPLILAEYEDLTHAEIGVILQCSTKAVENRIYQARQLLRESLKKILDAI